VRGSAVYLDSSAILKLIFEEDESDGLRHFLADHPQRVSSVLARVEVLRTVGRAEDPTVTRDASEFLGRVHLIRPDDALLSAAAEIEPATLRTFDSIHLVTALSLRPHLAGIVVYDKRLANAAHDAGLTVFAPA
jgi:predicted nucleic acid-binding protein